MRKRRVVPHEGDSNVTEKLLATFTTDRIVTATHVYMHNKMRLEKEKKVNISDRSFSGTYVHDYQL